MNIDFNHLIQKLIPYFFIALLAYVISSVIFIYLPKTGIDFVENNSKISVPYRKYDGFYSKNYVSKKENVKNRKIEKKVIEKKKETLKDYSLTGIYSTELNSGWASVINNRNKKSHILAQYEVLDGYILTKLYKDYVIFEKSAVEYRLDIKTTYKNFNEKSFDEDKDLVISGDTVIIKRDYLNTYVKDDKKIWNNISIKDVKINGKIEGFKISSIKKDSVFEKLGLEKGDIIKSVNNTILNSYAEVLKLYKELNDTSHINIEVLRKNQIMELNYEIN